MLIRTALLAGLVTLATPAISADIRVADEGLFARLDANGDGQLAAEELATSQARLFARLVRLGDEDGDGSLTHEEWKTATEPRRPAKPIEQKQSAELPGADAARLLLLKLDADADGVLTKEEAPSELRGVFNQLVGRLDRNDDGQLNRFELARGGPRLTRTAQQTARRQRWNVERDLKKLDRQQGTAARRFDQRPTPQRMLGDPKQALALFQEFDRNQDGKIERDEVPEQVRDRLGRLFRFGDRNRDNALSQREFLAASERASKFMQRMEPRDE